MTTSTIPREHPPSTTPDVSETGDQRTFTTMESLANASRLLLNLSTSLTYALLNREWTVLRSMEMVETLRALADRIERISPTETG